MKKLYLSKIIVRGVEWFAGLALLNLSWLLFSLPIFTIIPATDALYEMLYDWERKDENPTEIFRTFRATFQKNLKSSYKLGLPLHIILLFIGIDLYLLRNFSADSMWGGIFKYAFYTFSFLLGLAIFYAYPLSKSMKETHVRVLLLGLLSVVGHPLITLCVVMGLILLAVISSI